MNSIDNAACLVPIPTVHKKLARKTATSRIKLNLKKPVGYSLYVKIDVDIILTHTPKDLDHQEYK